MKLNQEEKEIYRSTFNKIHASEDLLRKVKNMNQKSRKKSNVAKKVVAAVAALAIVFVSSNAITYARQGETWVEKMVVLIDGKEFEAEVKDLENGEKVVTIETEDDDKSVNIEYGYEVDEKGDVAITQKNEAQTQNQETTIEQETTIKQEGEKVYLYIDDTKIDITEDIKDEKCQGEFQVDGKKYGYVVEGNATEYSISITDKN
ncbi:MAG: hypothetical protein U0L23_09545 [Lachnospiraceae bacterium]|nr:hypothetical protein [Lachnospiraceae bacterium]MEE1342941.1 hypothetical protein [Lachnospiraceae bacterium]